VDNFIEGWLIRYNDFSLPLELPSGKLCYEIIQPNAFAESVAAITMGNRTIEANIEHVDDAISRIGLTGKNVTIENLAEGVYATIRMLGDSLSNDVFIKAQAGVVSGFSVEFNPSPATSGPEYSIVDGNYVRSWSRLELCGFAICTQPCYPTAQIVRAGAGRSRALPAAVVRPPQAEAAMRTQWKQHEDFLAGVEARERARKIAAN
jgi:HK97 family phage prohead protease